MEKWGRSKMHFTPTPFFHFPDPILRKYVMMFCKQVAIVQYRDSEHAL